MDPRLRLSGAGRTTSTQTIEAHHQRLSTVDPGIPKAYHGLPDVTERMQKPEDVFPKPQRSNAQKSEGSVSNNLDGHDPKYNLEFGLKALNGFPNIHNYVQRHKELEKLTTFIDQKPLDVRKTVFLCGKSGFGKTQFATTYAQESKNKNFSSTFFVDATNKSTLNQSFAFILREQLWEHWPKLTIDRPETQPSDDQSVRNLVHQWLSQPDNKKWLLIFDNASDPDLLVPYLPPKEVDHGTVIITTQSSSFTTANFLEKNVPGQSRQINVEGFGFSDGKKLLVDVAGAAYQETDSVTNIILSDLEWCPCKIVQFANDVRREKEINVVYREIIEKTLAAGGAEEGKGDKLFNTACQRLLNDLGTGSPWNRRPYHDARKLLLLFSHLHSQDIWYGLVEKGQIDPGPPGGDHWLQRSTNSPLDFKERINILMERGFVAVDSLENIEVARITIHERLQTFLLQGKFNDDDALRKETLRFASSCVAYSDCGSYHPQQYEIRKRLMPHVDALRQHLEDRNEYGLRHFHFNELEPKQQAIIRRMLRDEKDLQDDFIGFLNPFENLAYLLEWDTKLEKAIHLIEKAYVSLAPSMSNIIKSHWTILIAHLLYLHEDPDTYRRALRYAQDAEDNFSKIREEIRAYFFARRLGIALKTRWGSSEEKADALRDNEEVVSRVGSSLPKSIYLLSTLDDSGDILLENGLFERSSQRYLNCFRSLQERLPLSHRKFATLAAKIAITTVAEKDIYLKNPATDEEKAISRRLMTLKAWEGFKKCLGDDHPTTIGQARILAWLYEEDNDLQNCIHIRRWIITSLQQNSDSGFIDQAKERRFLAEVLLEKNSTLQENDDKNFSEIKLLVDEGVKLIQLADSEKDEKVLALQFRMACLLCDIYEYPAALPVLQETLAHLRAIKDHSQANMNTALGKLCDVYYKLSMTSDLENLLTEWTEPDIPVQDPLSALETLRKKAIACMQYENHQRAIPLLKKIQSHITSEPKAPQQEILENEFRIAECLELTDRMSEAAEMYKSIIESLDKNSTLDTSDRLLKFVAFRGLGDIHYSRDERRPAADMYEKALQEMEACEDRQNSDVRFHEAMILYSIAKVECEIYFLEDVRPTSSVSVAQRFEKVLSFQDDSGRSILDDSRLGSTFHYLGFIDTLNNRAADAEKNLRKALSYFSKERPPAIDSLDSSYHLLIGSLWEQIGDPDTDKVMEIFIIMLLVLSNLGIFRIVQQEDFPDFTIAGLMSSEWNFSKSTSFNGADLALTIISEFAALLNSLGLAPQLSHTTFLRLLRTCEERFGTENWRSRNALWLLEDAEKLQPIGTSSEDDGELYLTKLGYFFYKQGDTQRNVWSDPGVRPLINPDDPLIDDTSRILVRLGKWESVLTQLKPELKDRLVYTPPPDISGWPQSWTYMPNVAKLKEERLDVPLRIANAPVIIPAPKRYSTMWSSIPPQDSHAPIDPSEPLDMKTIVDIFREYNFAQGFFLLLNRRLQIVVDDDFDYSAALAEKPILFGGLKVDYVRNTLVHTSSTTRDTSTHNTLPDLRINSTVVATRFKRPILGLFGKSVPTSVPKIARIGVRIRPKKERDRNKQLLTIPTHSFKKAHKSAKKTSGIFHSLRRLSGSTSTGIKVFEESTRHQIGTIAVTFGADEPYSLGRIIAPDISLVSPLKQKFIDKIQSPIPNLDWISDDDWSHLKRIPHQSLKILGADDIWARGIRTDDTGYRDDCSIIGEGIFRSQVGRRIDLNRDEDVRKLNETTLGISRCILFRVQDWSSLDTPGSGIAVYTLLSATKKPALVGFVSFKQPPLDEGIRQENFTGKDMDDEDFSRNIRDGNVAFFGAWKLPPKLSEDYEIICVSEPLTTGQRSP